MCLCFCLSSVYSSHWCLQHTFSALHSFGQMLRCMRSRWICSCITIAGLQHSSGCCGSAARAQAMLNCWGYFLNSVHWQSQELVHFNGMQNLITAVKFIHSIKEAQRKILLHYLATHLSIFGFPRVLFNLDICDHNIQLWQNKANKKEPWAY